MNLALYIYILCAFSAIVYLILFGRASLSLKSNESVRSSISPPVSIIICARNEAKNLMTNLPVVFSQDYNQYEVIVVNDASWDNTDEVLEGFKVNHQNLSIVTISDEQKRTQGKKMALTLGIKRSKYDHLLLTDADCIPSSDQWIELMIASMSKGIVLGYGAYRKNPGLLNFLIRYDTWSNSTHFLGMALLSKPYMGVGRNLGYKKDIYISTGGFKKHYHIISGDDDLLINQVATHKNTSVCISPEAFTYTDSVDLWSDWVKKKTRHLSSSRVYSSPTKKRLFWYYTSLSSFYMFLCLGSALGGSLSVLGILFAGKTLIHMLISIPSAKRLQEMDLLVLLPILEPLNLLVNSFAIIRMRWSKTIQWK